MTPDLFKLCIVVAMLEAAKSSKSGLYTFTTIPMEILPLLHGAELLFFFSTMKFTIFLVNAATLGYPSAENKN